MGNGLWWRSCWEEVCVCFGEWGGNCGRSLCVREWQKEERKVVQHLRSDLCVPGGGHENGEAACGVGEFREKYVWRILFSVG